ncbi:MAG TPA: T9SS type A sorting domain-containing protein, partial [Ferruginibacter sp.]|nr:T9SS type A sorting domain-containing protein [Ferruginibacter sp.]
DGKFTYSKILPVNSRNSNSLGVFPNPVRNQINVTHARALKGAVLSVVNIHGITLVSLNTPAGSVSTTADLSTLPKGNYMLIYTNGTERTITKFVK